VRRHAYLWLPLILPVLVAGTVLLGIRKIYWRVPASAGEHVVVIPLKSGTATIGRLLQEAGVVRSGEVFRHYVVLTGQARRLKAGEYKFPAGADLGQVTRRLASGRTVRHTLTIPEGYSARQIAEKLTAEKLADGNEFLAVAHNARLAREWGVPADSLEGFLFPDTYEIPRGMLAEQIAKRMVERFREKVGEDLFQGGRSQGMTELELVTLASIIEREVRVPEERAKVASVFYNRLRKKMRLESCATVLYSQNRIRGVLSLNDLENNSPYNTYRHRGLPPGPISNPGISALQAAAFPAQTEYLFFVVRPDGQHVFSKDFESHKRAKWIQRRAREMQNSGTAPAHQP